MTQEIVDFLQQKADNLEQIYKNRCALSTQGAISESALLSAKDDWLEAKIKVLEAKEELDKGKP